MYEDGDIASDDVDYDEDDYSDWFSSSTDAFDEYEDYVMETGHDPYHVFDDYRPTLRERIRAIRMRIGYVIELRKLQLRAFLNGDDQNDIPF